MASSDKVEPVIEGVVKMDVADVDEKGPSKSALKKAAKMEKMAADRAEKKTKVAHVAKTGATEANAKSSGKAAKIAGAALIGIDVDKELDFAGWYQQVLTKGDLIDYYDIQGCYILKPGSWSIWEKIQRESVDYCTIHAKLTRCDLLRLVQ